MARISRYHIIEDGSTFHITWKCHDNTFLLEETWAKEAYYNLLLKYKDMYNVTIHSYCFMSNHPHLTGRIEKREDLSHFFRVVNSCFAQIVNYRRGRRGQVIMDRFKSPRIESDEALLRVMIYNDMNPIRARVAAVPEYFRFSSYHYYACGKEDALVTPAPSYIALGDTPEERQTRYRDMIHAIIRHERQTGKIAKKNYSSVHFIGDPSQVMELHHGLKEKLAEERRNAKLRHEARFRHMTAPPRVISAR